MIITGDQFRIGRNPYTWVGLCLLIVGAALVLTAFFVLGFVVWLTALGIALLKGSRVIAFMEGRDFVIPDDVKGLITPALSHRLRISPEAEMENVTPETIIDTVVAETPVPTVQS